jgi:outer membrane lipoprotein carrier protein
LLSSILAAAQPQQDLVRRVDDHYNHLRTLRAHYSEHYTGMGLDRTESGTLTLKKPGLMRWSYDKPTGKVFVLDGKFAWFYTPGDAQVSRTPAKQLDDLRSPLRFLLGHTQLAKELDQITTAPEGANFKIAGVPKGMAQRVHQLTLVVTQAGIIQSMKIEETDGATTDFTFTSIEENAPANPTDFLFTPPPGISIVDGQSPI